MRAKPSKLRTVFLGLVCIYAACKAFTPTIDEVEETQAADEKVVAVFPGAMGFGSNSPAGSGRHFPRPQTTVFRVTTLNASGPGSLRACVEHHRPRTCVFEISGVIQLSKSLVAKSPFLTIAGQTAPEPGVMLRGAGLVIKTHDVLVQHIEVRIGDDKVGEDPTSRDGIAILGKPEAFNIVIDHVSVSWALDENASIWYPNARDITFSNCIFAEGLQNSIHPKGLHSKGLLIGEGAERVSIIRNVFAHNVERNPALKTKTSTEMINNVVYGWGGRGRASVIALANPVAPDDPLSLDLIGNVFKPSPESHPDSPMVHAMSPSSGTRVFVLDNITFAAPLTSNPIPALLAGSLLSRPVRRFTESDWALVGLDEKLHRSHSRFFQDSSRSSSQSSNVKIIPAEEVMALVPQSAGSRPARRNKVDERIIADVLSGTGGSKDCVAGCERSAGGWPEYEVNRRAFVLPTNYLEDRDGNGMTVLEERLAQMAREVEDVRK